MNSSLDSNKKVILIGGNGLFSFNFMWLMKEEFEIHCFTRSSTQNFPGIVFHQFNSYENIDLIKGKIEAIEPQFIINAAGLTSVEKCEESWSNATYANITIPENLSLACQQLGIPFVHISTDHFGASHVFEANENQIELPRNNYAASKLEADRRVERSGGQNLIVRTNFFGWGHRQRVSFSDYILREARSGKTLKLFSDVIFSPILIDDLIDDVLKLVFSGSTGTFNIVGNQSLTKYSFGMRVLRAFEVDCQVISKDCLELRSGLVPRPLDMSLSRRKLDVLLGFNVNRGLDQMISRLRETEERQLKFFNLT